MKLFLLLFLLIPWLAFAQDLPITGYPADPAPTCDDLILTVNDPAGTPADRKVALTNLFCKLSGSGSPGISAGDGREVGRTIYVNTAASPNTLYMLVDATSGANQWLQIGLATIEGVTAGAGLIGGGPSGAVALDIAVTAPLTVAADAIGIDAAAVNLSGRTGEDKGTSDAYVASLPISDVSYSTNAIYILVPNTANTGAASVDYNSIGIRQIKKLISGAKVDLTTGDFCVGGRYPMFYDGTDMVTMGTLCNPSATTAPGGSDTQVQYNNAGAFGGDAGMTYNPATDVFTALGGVVSGNCATNCLRDDTSAVTGEKIVTWLNESGTIRFKPPLYVPLTKRGAVTISEESIVTDQPTDYWAIVTDTATDSLDFRIPATANLAAVTTGTVRLIGVSKNLSPSGDIVLHCAMKFVRPGTDTYAAHTTTGEVAVTLTPATQNRSVAATSAPITLNGTYAAGAQIEGSCQVDPALTTSGQLTDFRLLATALLEF